MTNIINRQLIWWTKLWNQEPKFHKSSWRFSGWLRSQNWSLIGNAIQPVAKSLLPWKRPGALLLRIIIAPKLKDVLLRFLQQVTFLTIFKSLNAWDPIRIWNMMFVTISPRRITINRRAWCFSLSKWTAKKSSNSSTMTIQILRIMKLFNITLRTLSLKKCQTSKLGLCRKKYIE